jgi:four helix bundle protein
VCANIAEAWPKRRYQAHFVSKLSDGQSEAEETRVWLEFAFRCQYLAESRFRELDDCYDKIVAQLVLMMTKPRQWMIH